MRKVTVRVSTNKVGSTCEDTFSIDDDTMNEDDIENIARDVALEMVEWDYTITEEKE